MKSFLEYINKNRQGGTPLPFPKSFNTHVFDKHPNKWEYHPERDEVEFEFNGVIAEKAYSAVGQIADTDERDNIIPFKGTMSVEDFANLYEKIRPLIQRPRRRTLGL